MKVYVDVADSGKTITYKEEYGKRQYLYVHDNEGFIFKDLADYAKQAKKEVCEKFVEQFMLEYTMGNEPIEDIIYKVAKQIQGE